jgi:hypothetical protein
VRRWREVGPGGSAASSCKGLDMESEKGRMEDDRNPRMTPICHFTETEKREGKTGV